MHQLKTTAADKWPCHCSKHLIMVRACCWWFCVSLRNSNPNPYPKQLLKLNLIQLSVTELKLMFLGYNTLDNNASCDSETSQTFLETLSEGPDL